MMPVRGYHYSRSWMVYWSGQSPLICLLSYFAAVRRQATQDRWSERARKDRESCIVEGKGVEGRERKGGEGKRRRAEHVNGW